ncbi:Heavy-metal-associated domain protein [Lunatimonas lonarensis]|uniref:Heavy-metal-associated domain protein n=1 Tax=Lunatimonas lonarensis TaxID=1232681 RepID=R7ZT67_9BACT|nr:sulfite exporter TauE/SafE family protein [Lunatimonas lonarensis]EON77223.1 Heavy-metal-associated domain protein [Lunatimonas lonarensis]
MIWTALLLGFFGSFHCVGMCGPIALALSARDQQRYLVNKLAYNLGRAMTYASLGTLVGLLGFSLGLAGLQQWLSVFLGIVIVFMAFFYKRSERILGNAGWFGLVNKLKQHLGFQLRKRGFPAFFLSGMLNGLLPCGMVYVALAASLALQSPLQGAVYMFVFGVGTMPVIVVLMVSQGLVSGQVKKRMHSLLPYMAVFIGLLFIVRGLGLGIHVLSPQLTNASTQSVTEITMCE